MNRYLITYEFDAESDDAARRIAGHALGDMPNPVGMEVLREAVAPWRRVHVLFTATAPTRLADKARGL